MKNQYFGDINDYRKYGLLKSFSESSFFNIALCWMLTQNDTQSDGNRVKYLDTPEIWEKYDPKIFQLLRKEVRINNIRNIKVIENSDIFPNCTFFNNKLTDNGTTRKKYMQEFLACISPNDLVFFDPDNGIEVKSVQYGKKRSSKYLYYEEIKQTFNAGHSILIYQHLPPQPRNLLADRISNQLKQITNQQNIYQYWTQYVVFFLVSQPHQIKSVRKVNELITKRWSNQITSVTV